MIKAYIVVHNLYTWTRETVEWLQAQDGVEPVILDNNSTYQPLKEWYRTNPCEIIRFNKNFGCNVFWKSGMFQAADKEFILTDPDLDYTGVPADWLEVLRGGFSAFPQIQKVGFSLAIKDIPSKFPGKNDIQKWEAQFWKEKKGIYFKAMIDTTFALYNKDFTPPFRYIGNCVRVDSPYTVKHRPWYLCAEDLDEELVYYRDTANNDLVEPIAPDGNYVGSTFKQYLEGKKPFSYFTGVK